MKKPHKDQQLQLGAAAKSAIFTTGASRVAANGQQKVSGENRCNGEQAQCRDKHSTSVRMTDVTVGPSADRPLRQDTEDLKRLPDDGTIREAILAAVASLASSLAGPQPLGKRELERLGRELLQQIGQSETYLGFTMVLIGNAIWSSRFLATPFRRRMLLLPRNVNHHQQCTSTAREREEPDESCLACWLDTVRQRAEQLGYQVQLADRSSTVLNTIVQGNVDAILGIASMNVLEKAIDKTLIAGVPSYAVPLPTDPVSSEKPAAELLPQGVLLDGVLECHEPNDKSPTFSYLALMRAANGLFKHGFERLVPRSRSATVEEAATPLGKTEDIAYRWLANGGKRFRPFITLAAYDAMTSSNSPDGLSARTSPGSFPDSVRRVAMAIEAFHKASLVHDDIQDDDDHRYGQETLHRSQGVGPAINIGDYLIGLGYRLVNSCRRDLGPDVAADIVQSMADAHIKLCDGQGAEMAWQLVPDWSIGPADALQIYTLKTSPAFEAALYAGLRMAGPVEDHKHTIAQFAEYLGVGFQVLNDLKDWEGDADNKLVAGQDALAVRPTVLLALALAAASESQRAEFAASCQSDGEDELRLHRLRKLYHDVGAFERAFAIVDHSREQALALAKNTRPTALQQLLCFLVDSVLSPETLPIELDEDFCHDEAAQLVAGR